jgi:uncharacterized repeat protein (TIGR03803 family)
MTRKMFWVVFRAALAIVSAPLLVNLLLITDAQASTEKVLYSFDSGTDANTPVSGLIFDPAGNLYGTSASGGANNDGAVFELTPGSGGKWTEQVIYSFTSKADGMVPLGGVIMDAAGNLYGTTSRGALGSGTVFTLIPGAGGTWILHTFNASNGHDGAAPDAPVVIDSSGNIFGTTVGGGKDRFYGVVFELSLNTQGHWQEKILHAFTDGNDGGEPNAGLTFDAAGNLYGTGASGAGQGVAFKETLGTNGKWKYSVVHAFNGGSDGIRPYAGFILDSSGNLYSTTKLGGTNGLGTVYMIKP